MYNSIKETEELKADESRILRRLTLTPAMCGHNALLVGRVGDWTWDAAARFCGVNPYDAKNDRGEPTYLSFCYYHITGSSDAHLRSFLIGDRVEVLTQAYQSGRNALHTVHRIRRIPETGLAEAPLDLNDIYTGPSENCLYLQTYNRWVSRVDGSSNEQLVKAAPPDFKIRHLPRLDAAHQPRNFYGPAIEHQSFCPNPKGKQRISGSLSYQVNPARDINGVGLLYFASYFNIIDETFLKVWRDLGGSTASFLNRQIIDKKVVFLGNADYETQLSLEYQWWETEEGNQHFNTVIRRENDKEIIAIATVIAKM